MKRIIIALLVIVVIPQLAWAAPRVLWQAGGTAVCTATGDQDECRLAPDGQGGVLFSWIDEPPSHGIG